MAECRCPRHWGTAVNAKTTTDSTTVAIAILSRLPVQANAEYHDAKYHRHEQIRADCGAPVTG